MIDSLNGRSYDVIMLLKGTKPNQLNPGPYDRILEALLANYKLKHTGPIYAYYVKM